jgi:hypothetical protein
MRHEGARADGYDGTLGFALGSLNVLVVLLTVLLAAGPGALGGVHILLALYFLAALWVASAWATAGALRGLPVHPLPPWWQVWARGMAFGGLGGSLFALLVLLGPLTFGAVHSIATGETSPAILIGLVLYGSIGVAIAFPFGATAGLLLGTLERLLMAGACAAARWCDPRRGNRAACRGVRRVGGTATDARRLARRRGCPCRTRG